MKIQELLDFKPCCVDFDREREKFEFADHQWSAYCLGCGGGAVLSSIRFCPYCGQKLPTPDKETDA